jgi:hypothetical protein
MSHQEPAVYLPVGITIGVAFWPPLFMFIMSFGGQDKSAGGQFVFSFDRTNVPLGLPTFVTSLLLLLLLLLSALATPGGASGTTTANRVVATATRRPLLIALCQCCYLQVYASWAGFGSLLASSFNGMVLLKLGR